MIPSLRCAKHPNSPMCITIYDPLPSCMDCQAEEEERRRAERKVQRDAPFIQALDAFAQLHPQFVQVKPLTLQSGLVQIYGDPLRQMIFSNAKSYTASVIQKGQEEQDAIRVSGDTPEQVYDALLRRVRLEIAQLRERLHILKGVASDATLPEGQVSDHSLGS